ncbi:MAG: type IV toxin-antitoxin system AbiEi family antitoxin domain-containing protein [Elusimicrobiota bacterium]|jgi:predicted transcriptional regulator of viral defense system|nr:type IV toxin-antitoxin system AbiEi family antitoxin domain-containing protein [Elusimicrobiota bacterium]
MDEISKFSTFSGNEIQIINKLTSSKKDIFYLEEIQQYMPPSYKYTPQFIYRLKRKKILTPIKRGVYSFSPIAAQPTGWQINTFKIGNIFFANYKYYIGHVTAFNMYGLTEQIPVVTFFFNTKMSAEKEINYLPFKFIKLKEEFFYGIKDMEINDEIVKISDFERTIIDFVDKWNFREARGRVVARIKDNKCDLNKLIEYAVRFPKIRTRKKMGVIFDKAQVDERLTAPLYESVKNTALTSTCRFIMEGKKNKKWGIIVCE